MKQAELLTTNNDQRVEKFSELLLMAQTLSKDSLSNRYDDVTYYSEYMHLTTQYNKLRLQAKILDPGAVDVLPNVEHSPRPGIVEVQTAIAQLVSYLSNKVQPVSLSYNRLARALIDEIRGADSLVPLSALLVKLGLSNNWAIGASALSLQEVMVNHKLDELELTTEGTIDTRFRRLVEEARKRRIQVPELLTGPFYTARSKVLHAGKEPTSGELKIIIDYLHDLQEALEKIHK